MLHWTDLETAERPTFLKFSPWKRGCFARKSSGANLLRSRYLPPRKPRPSGLYATMPMPSSRQVGTTSACSGTQSNKQARSRLDKVTHAAVATLASAVCYDQTLEQRFTLCPSRQHDQIWGDELQVSHTSDVTAPQRPFQLHCGDRMHLQHHAIFHLRIWSFNFHCRIILPPQYLRCTLVVHGATTCIALLIRNTKQGGALLRTLCARRMSAALTSDKPRYLDFACLHQFLHETTTAAQV